MKNPSILFTLFTTSAILLISMHCQSIAAGFDCAKATSAVEKTICADPTLSNLDSKLSDAFHQALSRSQDQTALKKAQIDWLKQRDACAGSACLRQTYETRIAELSQLSGNVQQSIKIPEATLQNSTAQKLEPMQTQINTNQSYSQKNNSKNWNIIGIEIGNSLDNAKDKIQSNIKGVDIKVNKGTMTTRNGYETPEFIYGAECETKTTDTNQNEEAVYLVLSLYDPQEIISITRSVYYKAEKPSVDNVMNSLIKKYGEPLTNRNNQEYHWFDVSDEKIKEKIAYKNENLYTAWRELSAGTNLTTGNVNKLGLFVSCYIDKNRYNEHLVDKVYCTLCDGDRINKTKEYVKNLLDNGSAEIDDKLKSQGDSAKVNF